MRSALWPQKASYVQNAIVYAVVLLSLICSATKSGLFATQAVHVQADKAASQDRYRLCLTPHCFAVRCGSFGHKGLQGTSEY